MPELPEIESLRRSLSVLVGARVTRSCVHRADMVLPAGSQPLPGGCSIVGLHRHGKQLAVETRRHGCLVVHLGMSGSLRLVEEGVVRRDRHVHAEWSLRCVDGTRRVLLHRDPRRFGWLEVLGSLASVRDAWSSALGPDGLGVRESDLEAVMRRTSRAVKAVLLDQAALAGVGNIYADESLFRARIHPARPGCRLSRTEISRLVHVIRTVLRKASDLGGSTIRDHRGLDGRWGSYQRLHHVYGRGGLPCRRCGSPLRTMAIQQRSTVFCGRCQPKEGRASTQSREAS